MPTTYERDDVKRRVVVVIRGPFDVEEILVSIIERQRHDGTWGYGVLYDTRGMTGQPSFADLKRFMQSSQPTAGESRRGPLALLATDPVVYGMCCTYTALLGSRRAVQAFRDWDEADAWLTAQTKTAWPD